ncbi:MAG TPA: Fe-Mn family superoxide dismutase [Thermoanaerobaculia bacterium]|nr:Fe-Mn family superoxide dismutase [Thermoanaerobaculia bacterium]
MTAYTAKDFSSLIGTPGFSEQMLTDHFTLYKGYVTNTNKLLETTQKLSRDGKAASPEFSELRRRLGWEWNGMRLHELYFGNMTKERRPLSKGGELQSRVADSYGSFDAWASDFKATGAMRGIGWAAVLWDPLGKRVMNSWINEHDKGEAAGCPILLIMDVFEHAFMRDYGLKKDAYIEAFFAAIDWTTVERRMEAAQSTEPALVGVVV